MGGHERVILIRYGEISLKGGNRPYFERSLDRAIKAALAGLAGFRVWRDHGRFYLAGPGDQEEYVSRLRRVFGIVSLSPAISVSLNFESIKAAALEVLREAMNGAAYAAHAAGHNAGGLTFKVNARRANKSFPLDSMALNREIGAFLLDQVPGLVVDVHEPDITVSVDLRDRAFVYTTIVPAYGGLPPRISGRAVLLLSGGIDSPVAGWMAMKRGLEVHGLHFESPPFTSERARLKVEDLGRSLSSWGAYRKTHYCTFTKVQKTIYEKCPPELGVTIMRRFMFRIATRLAKRVGALALVTGESLGQVASQTLESMHVINQVCDLPVLRPLIGMDKTEIIDRARDIGTYDISIRPYEDCCTIFVPRCPSTKPALDQVEQAESAIEINDLVEDALAGIVSD